MHLLCAGPCRAAAAGLLLGRDIGKSNWLKTLSCRLSQPLTFSNFFSQAVCLMHNLVLSAAVDSRPDFAGDIITSHAREGKGVLAHLSKGCIESYRRVHNPDEMSSCRRALETICNVASRIG